MKKISIKTNYKQLLADLYTPVGIYLRLRDRFRDTILLESSDYHAGENSYTFIGINAIAGIEIRTKSTIEYKLPGQSPEKSKISSPSIVPELIWNFMQRFEINSQVPKPINVAQGLFGYCTYDSVQFFDSILLENANQQAGVDIPLMRYRLYQYVIAINHFKNELFICENAIDGMDSDIDSIESLIKSKDLPTFPFSSTGLEHSNLTDAAYIEMVKKGIASCHRGDVFQIVLSRRFQQSFSGDEFNVYRALRSINPSPYLFYFDYGDYKLMGSSPESQLIVQNGKAIVHPIAGTFKRTGNDEKDKVLAIQLENDPKENAEHVMLVDLARNDLSRMCSEVEGKVVGETNPFKLLAVSFPAGTLSGAPKFKAMQLINENEPTGRSYYGGAIGYMGFDGTCNHAIMIRTFLSKQNTLFYQAGAGIVAASNPESELQEVNNKLNALKQAIVMAQNI